MVKYEHENLTQKTKTAQRELPRQIQWQENKSVKLPKIDISTFSGDHTSEKKFLKTFDATVNKQTDITEIENFTYLKLYLRGNALQAIENFQLTAENYEEAYKLLEKKYGNEQLIISSYVNKLMKLEP